MARRTIVYDFEANNLYYGNQSGSFNWQTQAQDLQPAADTTEDSPTLASVLAQQAPKGDYVLDTKVKMTVPNDGSSAYSKYASSTRT